MFKRYMVETYFIDDLIFKKNFKSINNAIKVCCGFDIECHIEITDLLTDKIICNSEVHELIQEFINDCEDY